MLSELTQTCGGTSRQAVPPSRVSEFSLSAKCNRGVCSDKKAIKESCLDRMQAELQQPRKTELQRAAPSSI